MLAVDFGDAACPRIQNELFDLGADLAVPYVEGDGKLRIEQSADRRASRPTATGSTTPLEPLKSFVLPGGTETGARLHVARTVCRRAELTALHVEAREPARARAT